MILHNLYDLLAGFGEEQQPRSPEATINAYFKREGNHLVAQPGHPLFAELVEKVREKELQHQQAGVIEAEAIVKCGGRPALDDAVRKGEIKTGASPDGVMLYFFPSVSLRDTQVTKMTNTATKSKAISNIAYDAVSDEVLSMNWANLACGKKALGDKGLSEQVLQTLMLYILSAAPLRHIRPCIGATIWCMSCCVYVLYVCFISQVGPSTDTDNGKGMADVKDGLNKAFVDLTKASKAASAIFEKFEAVDSPCVTLTESVEKLQESMESLEVHLSDIIFMLKFKKVKSSGEVLSVQSGQKLLQDAGMSLSKALDVMKQTRALLPNPPKKD